MLGLFFVCLKFVWILQNIVFDLQFEISYFKLNYHMYLLYILKLAHKNLIKINHEIGYQYHICIKDTNTHVRGSVFNFI